MPTGYTAAVETGEITSLKDFAMSCARGMGALVMMRDEPHGAPIPERFEPSTEWHEKKLQEARAELTEVDTLSDEECEARAQADYEARLKSHEEYEAAQQARNDRYEAMIKKVRAWHTEAEGIREFMLDQLRISMTDYTPFPPERLSGFDWKTSVRQEALRSISYAEKAIADETHRTAMRNQWLADLRRSLENVDD